MNCRDYLGLRLILTKTLRQYDAGVLGTGAVNGLTIPPKAKDYATNVFCTGACTKQVQNIQ